MKRKKFKPSRLKGRQIKIKTMKKNNRKIQEKHLPNFSGIVFGQGNAKIPESTLIANLTSAENCPSRKLGLCRVEECCYARKCERIYPNYKKRNLAIEDWMGSASADEIYELMEAYIDQYEN